MKKRFSKEQDIGILREGEVVGVVIRDICRKRNITEQMFFRWRSKFGGMTVSDAHKLKEPEAENLRLKRSLPNRYWQLRG